MLICIWVCKNCWISLNLLTAFGRINWILVFRDLYCWRSLNNLLYWFLIIDKLSVELIHSQLYGCASVIKKSLIVDPWKDWQNTVVKSPGLRNLPNRDSNSNSTACKSCKMYTFLKLSDLFKCFEEYLLHKINLNNKWSNNMNSSVQTDSYCKTLKSSSLLMF